MAQVKATPVPPSTPTLRLTLDMSAKEAADLRELCRHISGSPSGSRGMFSAIGSALDDACGATYALHNKRLEGSIRFLD